MLCGRTSCISAERGIAVLGNKMLDIHKFTDALVESFKPVLYELSTLVTTSKWLTV